MPRLQMTVFQMGITVASGLGGHGYFVVYPRPDSINASKICTKKLHTTLDILVFKPN